MGEEADQAEAIVEADDDDALRGEARSILPWLRRGAALESRRRRFHTITGCFAVGELAPVHTLATRQSSLISSRNTMSVKMGACTQRSPNFVAALTPLHFAAGCGAFQR
jgi:hypothetical protein